MVDKILNTALAKWQTQWEGVLRYVPRPKVRGSSPLCCAIIYMSMTIESIQPLADRVVVLPLEAESKTQGGIFIPDQAKEKPVKGKVVAIGTNIEELKLGDIVIHGKYSGTEIEIEGIKHLIMREAEVFAVEELTE